MPNTLMHVWDGSKSVPVSGTSGGLLTPSLPSSEDTTLGIKKVASVVQVISLTASGLIKSSPGLFCGAYVLSSSSGTIRIRDGGSSGTIIVGQSAAISVSAGALDLGLEGRAINFGTNIYADIGGTVTIEFYYI